MSLFNLILDCFYHCVIVYVFQIVFMTGTVHGAASEPSTKIFNRPAPHLQTARVLTQILECKTIYFNCKPKMSSIFFVAFYILWVFKFRKTGPPVTLSGPSLASDTGGGGSVQRVRIAKKKSKKSTRGDFIFYFFSESVSE